MPIKPVPRRARDPGSGTVVVKLVSPLEILVCPLKKPLPVLTVNWTVAPSTVEPLYQVPLREPVKV
jgi:hypothetical protein